MAHPEWGSVDNRLTRKTPASYSDGVYTMDQGSKERPSPRSLSQAFMQGTDGVYTMDQGSKERPSPRSL